MNNNKDERLCVCGEYIKDHLSGMDCGHEAVDAEQYYSCTCSYEGLGGNDPDSYTKINEWCPVHGRDPDAERDARTDDKDFFDNLGEYDD